MKLYLMRHGNAASPGEGKPSVLTPKGEKNVAKVGLSLKKKKMTPLTIWHSPLPRAAQTAGIIQGLLGLPPEALVVKKGLVPEGSDTEIFREIYKFSGDLMLVSHLPFIKTLLAHFLDFQDHPEAFDFPAAGVVALERTGEKNALLWVIQPEDL